jgi:hypothetical protein
MNRPEHRSNLRSEMVIITSRTTLTVIIGITTAVITAMTNITTVKACGARDLRTSESA